MYTRNSIFVGQMYALRCMNVEQSQKNRKQFYFDNKQYNIVKTILGFVQKKKVQSKHTYIHTYTTSFVLSECKFSVFCS